MEFEKGILADHQIRSLIDAKIIKADNPITDIQPASLDLRLGDVAFRMPASILPGAHIHAADVIHDFSMHKIPLDGGAVLEKNCVYLVPLQEHLHLPKNLAATANAKSTTGRLDIFTRLITDYGVEFDQVAAGYQGPLYIEISPRSFSVLVRPGLRLNQIRFRVGDAALSDDELLKLHDQEALVDSDAFIRGGLGFSVDLVGGEGNIVGYRAKSHAGLIDLAQINHYPVEDFWDPVYARKAHIILDPGAFYILASREEVRIPMNYAAEMAPYLAMVGEFRVHYAGFFDPGFGLNQGGARGVLEVRCHEVPFVLNHGQRVGRLIYEKMSQKPSLLYGADIGSNYQGQKLKLAKQFAMK